MAEKDPQSAPGNLTGKGAFTAGDDPRRYANGRPPKVLCTPDSVRELALAATEDSVKMLHVIVNSPNEHVQNRIQAARSLLNLGGANFPKVSLQTVQHQIGVQNFDALMQQASALLAGRAPPSNHAGSLLAHSMDNGPGPVIDVPQDDVLRPQGAAHAAPVVPAPTESPAMVPALVLVHPVPPPPAHLVVPQPGNDAPGASVEGAPVEAPDPELLALLAASGVGQRTDDSE